MSQAAKIVIRAGHTWWLCPNCSQKLAEIIGDRIVIRSGPIMITLGKHTEPDQTCHRCGASSLLRKEQAA